MGTSKSFSEISKKAMPNWGSFSSSVTRSCDGTDLSDAALSKIFGKYIRTIGGASKAGQGNSKVAGRGGIKTAKKLAKFFDSFGITGNVRQALSATGLTDIENKSVRDIINHLIEYCSGATTSIDDEAAKSASKLLLEDLLNDDNLSIDEIQELLLQKFKIETNEDLIIKYFGYYIYEHLSSWFYGHLIKEKNEADCNNLFRQFKDYVNIRIKGVHRNNPIQNIDWGSSKAENLIKNIQEEVLKIFE